MWNNDRIIPLDAQQVCVDYWQSAHDRRGHRTQIDAHTVAAVSGREEDGAVCQVLYGEIFTADDRSHAGVWERIMER